MSESFPDFEAPAADRGDTRALFERILRAIDAEFEKAPVVRQAPRSAGPVIDMTPRKKRRRKCCCCRGCGE